MSVVGTGRAGLPRMIGRDPQEPNRAASTLELFFDLVFVVAVGFAAEGLLGYDRAGHPLDGLGVYAMVFFGIWWAWIGFTWFASAFDTDDWLYRLLTVVQMGGVLVLAAGVPAAMEHFDLRVIVVGYVVMRLALVAQYLRSARDPRWRRTQLHYAAGVTAVQVLWILNLLVPHGLAVLSFVLLVACELLVPATAERRAPTPFHRHHIAERYGAFTLIVLGEGTLSVANALVAATREAQHMGGMILIGASALVLIAGMWWIYFAREQHGRLTSFRPVFAFGYAHYLVFAAAGAVAAGIEAAVDAEEHGSALPDAVVRSLTTVPVAVFLAVVWALALRPAVRPIVSAAVLALTALVALAALAPFGQSVAALLVVGVVAVLEVDARRGSAG